MWQQLKTNIFAHPKSSFIGVCGLVIAVTMAVMALPPKASVPVIIIAVGRAVIQFMQQDPGTVTAIVPGVPGIQNVPSHEIPDDPAAVPVVKP